MKTNKPKVCLVFPRMKYPAGDPPLGISYIASVIRDSCDLELIDTTFDNNSDKAINLLKNKQYDIVGFSVMTTMLKDALELALVIKQHHPNTLIIFGGPHPTMMPEQTINYPQVDAICIGEAELTFKEIVEKQNLNQTKGIWYKKDSKIIKNKPREFIKDLNSLPYPAFDMFHMEKYFQFWFQMDSVAENLKGISLITSRGCPYRCSFCQPTLVKLFGDKIRKRNPKKIVEELQYWKNKFNLNAFIFDDDTFIFDKEWVMEICDELEKADLNLIWGCNARANLIDEELFSKMKKVGLRKVFLGIESGSQRILNDIYNKMITIDQIKNGVKILKKLGLKVQGYFMIGAPTETLKEIKKTIKLARNLKIDEATFSITTPLPGTYLYDKTKHLISKDITEFDYYKTPVYNNATTLNNKKLDRLKKRALLSFYLSPKHIRNTLSSFMSIKGFKKNLTKLKRF